MIPLNPDANEPEVEILSSSPEPEEGFENPKAKPSSRLEGDTTGNPQAEEWKKKHDEMKESYVWLAADFDNYKKRTLKEQEENRKFIAAELLKEFLVVVDNLERALAALPADDQDKGLLSLKQGVDLTLKQFHSLLEKYGVKKIKALGEKFDPRYHQVLFQEAAENVPDETVLEELQSGYLLHDRVIRAAMVKIAKNTGKPSPAV
jgi:molecular chaperone GrpE